MIIPICNTIGGRGNMVVGRGKEVISSKTRKQATKRRFLPKNLGMRIFFRIFAGGIFRPTPSLPTEGGG